jgi:hypothetical protein
MGLIVESAGIGDVRPGLPEAPRRNSISQAHDARELLRVRTDQYLEAARQLARADVKVGDASCRTNTSGSRSRSRTARRTSRSGARSCIGPVRKSSSAAARATAPCASANASSKSDTFPVPKTLPSGILTSVNSSRVLPNSSEAAFGLRRTRTAPTEPKGGWLWPCFGPPLPLVDNGRICPACSTPSGLGSGRSRGEIRSAGP